MTARVYRCEVCAAPLRGVLAGVVVCPYCESENHLEREAWHSDGGGVGPGAAAQMARIAAEVDAMLASVQPKMEELREKFREAVRGGETEPALRYYEAYVRLSLAPAFHLWRSMPPEHPQREAELAKLDQTVAQQVTAMAHQLDVSSQPSGE